MKFKASLAATLLLVTPALAQTPSPQMMDAAMIALLGNAKISKTLDDIKADDTRSLEEQKRITEIPAPPFKEKVRAEYYLKRMQELGFKDATRKVTLTEVKDELSKLIAQLKEPPLKRRVLKS